MIKDIIKPVLFFGGAFVVSFISILTAYILPSPLNRVEIPFIVAVILIFYRLPYSALLFIFITSFARELFGVQPFGTYILSGFCVVLVGIGIHAWLIARFTPLSVFVVLLGMIITKYSFLLGAYFWAHIVALGTVDHVLKSILFDFILNGLLSMITAYFFLRYSRKLRTDYAH